MRNPPASCRAARGWAGRIPPTLLIGTLPRVSLKQRYRMRTPSTGREIFLEAEAGKTYRDRETGEPLEVVGKVVPVSPTVSRLPWAVENLRFCNWCDQLAQKDLNDCPTCGRRMAPIAAASD
jgi:hypothetical protein